MARGLHEIIALALIFAWFLFLPGESQAQKFLNKPVEFVVHAAAGGGSDIMARMMASIIEKEKLIPVTVAVVNRPGGSSAETYKLWEAQSNMYAKIMKEIGIIK
jgi:putative tricarboxylic transport membrane protein